MRGVLQEIVAALEAVVEDRVTPWGNDLDGRLESVERKLETNLVITLASAAVRDSEAAFLLSDLNLCASDDRTGERSAEKVDILVDGVALYSWPAELFNELLPQILHVALLGANLEGLLLSRLKVLLLTNVGHEADDTISLVNQVTKDAGSVETARVGETDLVEVSIEAVL